MLLCCVINGCISIGSSCLQHARVHPYIARLRPSMAADGDSSGLPNLCNALYLFSAILNLVFRLTLLNTLNPNQLLIISQTNQGYTLGITCQN